MPDLFCQYLLMASRAQVEMISKEYWLVKQQIEHTRKIVARSRALIERLDAHVAKLDPGAGLGKQGSRPSQLPAPMQRLLGRVAASVRFDRGDSFDWP